MDKTGKILKFNNLFPIAAITTFLLMVSIYLSYQNSKTIQYSREIARQARTVSINTNNIIKAIHLVDLGLRGNALLPNNAQISGVTSTAKIELYATFELLEKALKSQNYPKMESFNEFQSDVNDYLSFVDSMFVFIGSGKVELFRIRLSEDPGYPLYVKFLVFSKDINEFEDVIINQANQDYKAALKRAYLIEVIIFILAVPLLFFGAYKANENLKITDQLRQSEYERRTLLTEQNARLEKMVKQRTLEIQRQKEEIQASNEEILAQNEEISAHNELLSRHQGNMQKKNDMLLKRNKELQKARDIIQQQKEIIEDVNKHLNQEVKRQTVDLRNTNKELIEHNNRLKQFSFIVSHNLRSPIARLLGLNNLLTNSPEDHDQIMTMMTEAVHDLDQVIKDLSYILQIEEMVNQTLSPINIKDYLNRVINRITNEIDLLKGKINLKVEDIPTVPFLGPYMESIFYNLLANAVKYRDTGKQLEISIEAVEEDDFVRVTIADNGLGIDLERFRSDIFKLYKRFHTHVEGKGLGLYLVKSQMESLGGQLALNSEVGKGTEFILRFKK